ncbi:MAG: hypothetical protein L6R28_17315 [Planctomycetes bacterium]|nr:hypothetical protein [Planctomycetota bacterium]
MNQPPRAKPTPNYDKLLRLVQPLAVIGSAIYGVVLVFALAFLAAGAASWYLLLYGWFWPWTWWSYAALFGLVLLLAPGVVLFDCFLTLRDVVLLPRELKRLKERHFVPGPTAEPAPEMATPEKEIIVEVPARGGLRGFFALAGRTGERIIYYGGLYLQIGSLPKLLNPIYPILVLIAFGLGWLVVALAGATAVWIYLI